MKNNINQTTILHYMLAMILLSIYGVKVCPFLDTLSFFELVTPIFVAFVIALFIRLNAQKNIDMLALEKQSKSLFLLELKTLFFTGLILGIFNAIYFNFPPASGLKVIFGCLLLGVFIGIDQTLLREKFISNKLIQEGKNLIISKSYLSLPGKFISMSILMIGSITSILLMVIAKDLDWFHEEGIHLEFLQAKLSILAEVSFIVIVILSYSIRIILMFSSNLKILLNNQNRVLQTVGNGNLDTHVPVVTHDEFGVMAKCTNIMINELKLQKEEIHELNFNLEKIVDERTKKISTLLNNTGQGFLSFDSNCTVDDEYSNECTSILGDSISGKDVTQLLCLDHEKQLFFKDILVDTIDETEEFVRESFISLLPTFLQINNKEIKLEYKFLENKKFMLILTDITRQKQLEEEIRKEQYILKMIVTVVSDKDTFNNIKNDYESLYTLNFEFFDDTRAPLANLNELYRIIHTFKGTFLQLSMNESACFVHELEGSISSMIKNETVSNKELFAFLNNTNFKSCMHDDLTTIQKILGQAFIEKNTSISICQESMKELKTKVNLLTNQKEISNANLNDLLDSLNQMTSINVFKSLSSYAKMSLEIANKLQKEIYSFEIKGDKSLGVDERFKPFLKSLVHVFRNSIDHGIEEPDTRLLNNKDQKGSIQCSFTEKNNALEIIIVDDGAGINTEKIKAKMHSKDIDTSHLNKEEIMSYIFEDNLSTKDIISDISGRGIGLSAVKMELERLNGNHTIQSEINKGTTFTFNIPLKEEK